MAKYNGSIELISGLKQANGQDFPLVDASAVQVDESGTRLDKALKDKVGKSEIDDIASSSISVSETEPTKDSAEVWINPSTKENFSVPEIKDDTVNATDTWSSKKIESEISSLKSNIDNNTEDIKNNKILVDSNLENSGQAADAKVTGDAIASLKEDISTKITKFYASNQGEIHIIDSDNGKIMDMMLYGRSEQKQYKGINLLPPNIEYKEFIEVSIPKGTKVFIITDGTGTMGGNLRFFNADKTENMWFAIDKGDTIATSTLRFDAKYVQYLLGSGFESSKLCLGIGNEPIYEPYVGGIPSPSPEYPQEIKSVVNPTVKVTSEDGLKVQSVTLNNITLNAIPVSSGGNVTIDGQQYIADYVDVERGKLVKMVDSSKLDNTQSIVNKTEWLLAESQEIDLTIEEITAFKALTTYYPTTNISVNSEQLDGYTVFNYPTHFEDEWIKTKEKIASLNEDLVQLKKDIKTNSSIFTGKILNENTYKSGIAETPIPSTTSTISDGIIIPVLKNDVANSDISEIFRYSVPMTIANDLFPKNKAVTSDLPVNLGYRVEFYFSGKSFEVMLFGYGYLSICVDDNCVMEHSVRMPNDGNVYYQKVIFSSEIEHKHISLYIDGVFRGIKTNGVIEKYNANRLKIIADGDSITESTSIINGGEAVINSWISKLSKVFDYDLSNVALGGTGYINNGTNRVNMVDRFDKNVAKYNPDILVSMGGLNDNYDDLSALEVAINSYWNKVSNLQCKAICITPFNPQPSVMKVSEVFLPILQKTCNKYGIPLIDITRGITYDSTGNVITDNTNGYIKGVINNDNHNAFIGSDNTHLTLKGHEYLAKRLECEIYKLMKIDKYFNSPL